LLLAFAEAIERLRQLERLDLDRVRLLLQTIQVSARLLQGRLRVFHPCFDFGHARLCLLDTLLALLDQQTQFLDFTLAFEQAMFRSVGRKQRDALPANDVAPRCYVARGRRKLLAMRQRKSEVGRRIDLVEPITQNRGEFGIIATDALQ